MAAATPPGANVAEAAEVDCAAFATTLPGASIVEAAEVACAAFAGSAAAGGDVGTTLPGAVVDAALQDLLGLSLTTVLPPGAGLTSVLPPGAGLTTVAEHVA